MVALAKDWWDRMFLASIVLKGLDGLAELVGGVLLLIGDPERIHQYAIRLAQPELAEDPQDFIATHVLQASESLTRATVFYAAVYLLVHGAVKVVLVTALLANRLWAYPWMIGVLLAFIAYQLYQLTVSPTVGLIGLTVFDALVVVLTWHEYRRQRAHRPAARP